MATTDASRAGHDSLVHNWKYVLTTTNPPKGHMDPVSKWLYLTRAGVLPMTLVSASVAGLLAIYRDANVTWGWFALSAIGLVLAHMSNNLMNDLFDLEVGTDREEYPRNLYSPHPVLAGSRDAQAARVVRVDRQLPLPRDHDRAHGGPRVADRRRSRSVGSSSRPRTRHHRCGSRSTGSVSRPCSSCGVR